MRNKFIAVLLLAVFFNAFTSGLFAQSASNTSGLTSSNFDMTGSPQWAKDLRRAEIIAFGVFPFMYFFSNFGVSTGLLIKNRERGYAPWPFDGPAGYSKTDNQRLMTIGIAVGSSVLISLIDYSIVLQKRKKQEREAWNLAPGSPIIIRKPLYDEDIPAEKENPDSDEEKY